MNKRVSGRLAAAPVSKREEKDTFVKMAVLGIQFVITLMMATILSRVGPHLSLAR